MSHANDEEETGIIPAMFDDVDPANRMVNYVHPSIRQLIPHGIRNVSKAFTRYHPKKGCVVKLACNEGSQPWDLHSSIVSLTELVELELTACDWIPPEAAAMKVESLTLHCYGDVPPPAGIEIFKHVKKVSWYCEQPEGIQALIAQLKECAFKSSLKELRIVCDSDEPVEDLLDLLLFTHTFENLNVLDVDCGKMNSLDFVKRFKWVAKKVPSQLRTLMIHSCGVDISVAEFGNVVHLLEQFQHLERIFVGWNRYDQLADEALLAAAGTEEVYKIRQLLSLHRESSKKHKHH